MKADSNPIKTHGYLMLDATELLKSLSDGFCRAPLRRAYERWMLSMCRRSSRAGEDDGFEPAVM